MIDCGPLAVEEGDLELGDAVPEDAEPVAALLSRCGHEEVRHQQILVHHLHCAPSRVGAVPVECGEAHRHAVALPRGGVGHGGLGTVVVAVDSPLDPLSPEAGVGGGESQLPVGERLGEYCKVCHRSRGHLKVQAQRRVAALGGSPREEQHRVGIEHRVVPHRPVACHRRAVGMVAEVDNQMQCDAAVAADGIQCSESGVGAERKIRAVPSHAVASRDDGVGMAAVEDDEV